jgi:hypothetical protein
VHGECAAVQPNALPLHGPYYLAMILPVLAFGAGVIPASLLGWLALGVIMLFADKVIWWATERAWGKFS